MSGLLVFLPLPLLTWVIWSRRGADWRSALVVAALGWAAAIAVFTEVLSAFHAFRLIPAWIFWVGANTALALLAWKHRRRLATFEPLSGAEQLIAVAIGGLLGLALIVAVVAPPNTPDVLAYHLPRQLMWLQQGGVQHFVTNDERALMMPPLAEMIQAHALLLAGGDRWANLPQWIAFGLALVATSLIARELGVSRCGQWLAALLLATTPMAWHEATSAKNDLLVAAWIGVLCWLVLRVTAASTLHKLDWILVGMAAGVAVTTKSTAWIFVPVPLLLIVPAAARDIRHAWLVPALVLVIAGPHAARNLEWYGTPLGRQSAETGGAQGAETLSLRGAVSTGLRNMTLHLALPFESWNETLARAVVRVHGWLKQDPNDARFTLWNLRYGVEWGPGHEAIAGAPWQFVLGLLAFGAWVWRRAWQGALLGAMLMCAGGAFLCCLLLKWQPTGARLQLPIFLLIAPLAAWMLPNGARGMMAFAALALLVWWPFSETQLRPWRTAPTVFTTSRWENYFRFHPVERQYAEHTLAPLAAARPATVQIVSRHGFPYPIMKEIRDRRLASFWGALPATEPPGAVLVTEVGGQKLPPEFRPAATAEPFALVPGLEPYGLYLPARFNVPSRGAP